MKYLFFALAVLMCNFAVPAYSQPQTQPYSQSEPTGKPLLDLGTAHSDTNSSTPIIPNLKPASKGDITDNISAFFADKNVRRVGLLLAIIALGYNRFKRKKLAERSKS